MWNNSNQTDIGMNLRDSLRGIVKHQNDFGLCIDLELADDQESVPVFGYWSGNVPSGTEVLCSVKRWAKDHKDILVSVDSVCYEKNMGKAA